VDDEPRKRVITILASHLSDSFAEQPEVRGIRDDLKEAFLSAASS
jgi:hypothetical protein